MKLPASKLLFYLFLLIPLSFKIEVSEGIAFYPQELLMPLILIPLIYSSRTSIPKISYPYLFLTCGLVLILISTLISQYSFIEIGGILKTLKYLIYGISILYLSRYTFDNFLTQFNRVAILCIILTIANYLFKLVTFEGSFSDYILLSVWDINYVPSGFSNSNFSLSEMAFTRATGNHGIYGSYLVLIYLLNLAPLLENNKGTLLNKILVVLAVGNLLMINSRESLLLFIIVNAFFFLKPILHLKIKLTYLYIALFISVSFYLLVLFEVNISMVQKITYTIESFTKSGSEHNISLRYSVWTLIVYSFLLYPYYLLFGYGYNISNFSYHLEQTNNHFNLFKQYVTVPESIFFFFLSFGGILALTFVVLFFFTLLVETYKTRKKSKVAELFFYFVIGLTITNNTGASMLSDLLLAQFALVYYWIKKQYDTEKSFAHNGKS